MPAPVFAALLTSPLTTPRFGPRPVRRGQPNHLSHRAACHALNPWKTLEVEEGASHKEIKRAYRKLALRHHPDVQGSEEEFLDIQHAYQTLIDRARGTDSANERRGGWNFHDWYWQFRQDRTWGGKKRKQQGQGTARASGPTEAELASQLAGLRHRASSRKFTGRAAPDPQFCYTPDHPSFHDPAASSPSGPTTASAHTASAADSEPPASASASSGATTASAHAPSAAASESAASVFASSKAVHADAKSNGPMHASTAAADDSPLHAFAAAAPGRRPSPDILSQQHDVRSDAYWGSAAAHQSWDPLGQHAASGQNEAALGQDEAASGQNEAAFGAGPFRTSMGSHPATEHGGPFSLRGNQAGLEQQTEFQDADWYDAFLERQSPASVPRTGLDRLAQCIRFHLAAAFGYSSQPQSASLKPPHNLREMHPRLDIPGHDGQLELLQGAGQLLSEPLRSKQAHARSSREGRSDSTSPWSVRDHHHTPPASSHPHQQHLQLDTHALTSDGHPSLRSAAAQTSHAAPLVSSSSCFPRETRMQHLQDLVADARSGAHGSKPGSATAAVSRLHDQNSRAENQHGSSKGSGSYSDPSHSSASPAFQSESHVGSQLKVPAEQQHIPSEGSGSHSDRSHSSESPAFESESHVGSQLAGLRRRSALRKSR